MANLSTALRLPRGRLLRIADGLAVAVAASLPWSTSATGILVALWLVALLPTIDLAGLREEIVTPAGALPVLLVAFAALGLFWSDASWQTAFKGLSPYLKLLAIPLLFFQFRRSDGGRAVLLAFLVSCAVLLALSFVLAIWSKPFGFAGKSYGIPVKDRIMQSAEFTMAAFGALYVAAAFFRSGRRVAALALFLLAAAFFFNLFYVATSRTAMVVIPALAMLMAVRLFGWRSALVVALAGAVVGAALWFSSRNLQDRVGELVQGVEAYQTERTATSAGLRLSYWKRSLDFIAEAPLIGHGTGSTRDLFGRTLVGETGLWAEPIANPHNQTLAVGIQLGLAGIAILFALWLAHFHLFLTPGLIGWVGLMVVAQNIVSSLFNSHLFDFTPGWIYVFGVGVAGGMILRERSGALAQRPV
jgi:O-antigen ligase